MTKKEKEIIDAISGVALKATLQAIEKAKKTNISRVVEENNVLYEISPGGTKRKIKDLPTTDQKIPSKFTIK